MGQPRRAGRVAVGGTATGNIGASRDRDWFAVELVAGRSYTIDLRGRPTNDGTLSDPYFQGIHDADGNLLSGTRNDDGGEGYNSRVTFTATESGTHYIAAGAFSSRRGTYEVEVTDNSPPDTQEQVVEEPSASAQQPPAFDLQGYNFDLAENADGSSSRVSLGTVSATDPENETLTYSLVGGNASGSFEIDAASGELFYVGSGEDHESGTTSFDLTVRASDGDQSTDTTVTVSVTDVNEMPAFGQQGYAFDLAESADGSTNRVSLGSVSATDPESSTVSYSLVGGNEAGLFEIDAESGELFYAGSGEDYESGSTQFDLWVRASDGDQSTDTSVTVSVTDMDETPGFGQQAYAFDLAENADGSTNRVSLGSVSATDPDSSTLSYSLVGGNASGSFEIDASSGELFYVGTGEDYESGATRYDLTVRASDGDRSTDTTVTVDVTDVDEAVVVDPPVTQTPESVPQTVSEPAGEDFSADTSTEGQVAVGDTATGNVGSNGDRDWFAVELVAGRTYTIDLRGSPTDDGTLSDPYFQGIHDADGNLLSGTRNDDGGEGYNSRVTFTATESGTHYIAAGAFSSRQGTYEVEVRDNSPTDTQDQVQEPPAAPADSDAVRADANVVGDITALDGPRFLQSSVDGDGDRIDYYRFTLTEAKEIGLGLRRQDANADLFLEDADGTVLYRSTEAGTSNEAITETLLAGTYYVRVEAQEEDENNYVFRYGVSAADPAAVQSLEDAVDVI